MAKANLSPALHAELSEQLEKQLDETDELDSLRKAVGGAFRDELKRSRLAVARTRRQLKGQELPQKEIPGTERAQVKRDPFIVRLMAAARELLEYREEEEQKQAASSKEAKPEKKGLTAVTLHTAGGKSVTATPAQLQAGLDELERRKKAKTSALLAWKPDPRLKNVWIGEGGGRKYKVTLDEKGYFIDTLKPGLGQTGSGGSASPTGGLEDAKVWCEEHARSHATPPKNGAKKPDPEKLKWRVVDGGLRRAFITDGEYELALDGKGWRALWLPNVGTRKTLAFDLPAEAEAAEACELHHLERHADGLLKNAGAGELTKADTKGPAVARKKGGRRG